MEDVEFSDAFCRFVQSHIGTVDAAEVLVALFRGPDAPLPEGSAKYLESFRTAGLLDPELHYRPANEELARHAATLAQAWEERPVTLVRLIYALRDRKIRSFADAFKLRKD